MQKTIKEWRMEKGLTQLKVAEMSNIPYSTYRKKETGIRKWYFDEIVTICNVLGVNLDEVSH